MIDSNIIDNLKKAVAEREAKVAALEKRKRGARNYRLVLDLPLGAPPASVGDLFPIVSRAAVARKGTIFYVKEVEAVLSVVGTEFATGTSVTRVIPAPMRESVLTTRVKIRDTGADRDWQNGWIPLALFLGANLNGLRLGTAHGAVSGGSELVVLLQAQYLNASAAALTKLTGLSSVSSYFFQVTFNGVEVQA